MKKKALFIANLSSSSASGRQRLWALEACGVEVIAINLDEYNSSYSRLWGILGKLLRRALSSKNNKLLEADIVEIVMRDVPDLIWFEWPKDFNETFIKKLRGLSPSSLFISMQDDNPWGDRKSDLWMWKNYFRVIPYFDIHLIKRDSDEINLRKLGGKHFYRWQHGIYSPIFKPEQNKIICYPVSFVGTCMDNRIEFIDFLLKNGVPVHIFGTHWNERSNLPKKYPQNFHTAVRGEAYAKVINESQICLGFVSHSNHDEWTMRTYEVPGCAKLLLAERTPTHISLYKEDIEVLFFENKEECLKKINYYLERPTLCMDLGLKALKKCVDAHYYIEDRMMDFLNILNYDK